MVVEMILKISEYSGCGSFPMKSILEVQFEGSRHRGHSDCEGLKTTRNDRLTIITSMSRCFLSLSTALMAAFLQCIWLDISCNEQSFVNVLESRKGNENSISYKAQIQFNPWHVTFIYSRKGNSCYYKVEVKTSD